MSKFGAGGAGAPLRDQFGNIMAQRKPGEPTAKLTEEQLKHLQKE